MERNQRTCRLRPDAETPSYLPLDTRQLESARTGAWSVLGGLNLPDRQFRLEPAFQERHGEIDLAVEQQHGQRRRVRLRSQRDRNYSLPEFGRTGECDERCHSYRLARFVETARSLY